MKLFDTGIITDGRIAHRIGNEPVARFSQLGAFSERQLLAESSVVRVDPDIPWPAVALVSCGVATGFGSAVSRAGGGPRDTVAGLGVGGGGLNRGRGRAGGGGGGANARAPGGGPRRAGPALRATPRRRVPARATP